VFDPISSIAASNFTGYGINAWDSNGDLTYSSQSLNAQIIGSITESTSYTQTQAEFDTWGIPWVSVAAQNHKYEFRSLNFVSGGYDGTNDYYTKGGMSFLTFSPTVASGVFPYENAYCSFDLSGVGPAPGDKVSTIPSGAMKWLIAYFPN
jgi:hypothetical protein